MRPQFTRWCSHLNCNRLSRARSQALQSDDSRRVCRKSSDDRRWTRGWGRGSSRREHKQSRGEARHPLRRRLRVTCDPHAFGSGPSGELERHGIRTLVEAPGVGGNLIDHPLVHMLAALSDDAIKQASPETDHSRVSVLLRHTATGSKEFNDMQLYLMPLVDLAMMPGAPLPTEFPPQLIVTCVLQRPRSRGKLRLRSANPVEQPEIQLNYFDDHEDMRRMIDGLRLGWRLMHEQDI